MLNGFTLISELQKEHISLSIILNKMNGKIVCNILYCSHWTPEMLNTFRYSMYSDRSFISNEWNAGICNHGIILKASLSKKNLP